MGEIDREKPGLTRGPGYTAGPLGEVLDDMREREAPPQPRKLRWDFVICFGFVMLCLALGDPGVDVIVAVFVVLGTVGLVAGVGYLIYLLATRAPD